MKIVVYRSTIGLWLSCFRSDDGRLYIVAHVAAWAIVAFQKKDSAHRQPRGGSRD